MNRDSTALIGSSCLFSSLLFSYSSSHLPEFSFSRYFHSLSVIHLSSIRSLSFILSFPIRHPLYCHFFHLYLLFRCFIYRVLIFLIFLFISFSVLILLPSPPVLFPFITTNVATERLPALLRVLDVPGSNLRSKTCVLDHKNIV